MTDHVAHTSTGPVRLPTIDHLVVTCDNDYNDVRIEVVNGVGVGDVAQRAHSDAEDADRGVIAVIELEQIEKITAAISALAQTATTLLKDHDAVATDKQEGPYLGPEAQAQVEWLFGVQGVNDPTKGDQ